MSEVSLEAQSGKTSGEDPQLDCEEEDKEANIAEDRLSEDVKQESVDGSMGGDDGDEVMYEIDIDSAEENVETSDRDIREVDQGSQSKRVVTCDDGEAAHMSGSVDNGAHETDRHAERAEAPEDSGETHTETKESTMAEETHRSSAAEISVTSNGDLDQSPETVFQRDSYPSVPGALNLSESCVSPSNFASTTEGIIESGQYKGSASLPTSPVAPVAPSSAVAIRLARSVSDSQAEKGTSSEYKSDDAESPPVAY